VQSVLTDWPCSLPIEANIMSFQGENISLVKQGVKSNASTDDVDRITIQIGNNSNRSTLKQIAPRASGSQTNLIMRPDGQIHIERRSSSAGDILIAARKRVSQTTMPTVLDIIPKAAPEEHEPMLGAENVLERTGGKGAAGAFTEHMFHLDALASKYQTHIDPDDVPHSKGLAAGKAAEFLALYGPNVLTPPPKIPHWLLFLLQFTNLLMILLQITGLACIIIYIVNPSVPVNLYIGVLLYFVVIVTCYETFHQEAQSGEFEFYSLSIAIPPHLVMITGRKYSFL
jgi:magnesium-transporting ATPase (P-type)